MADHTNNPPVQRLRDGPLEASVWKNEGKDGPYYTVTLYRSYLEGKDWKNTSSLRQRDLLPLAELARRAHECIRAFQAEDKAALFAAGRNGGR